MTLDDSQRVFVKELCGERTTERREAANHTPPLLRRREKFDNEDNDDARVRFEAPGHQMRSDCGQEQGCPAQCR